MPLIAEPGVINTALILQSAKLQAEEDGLPPSEVANIDLRKLSRLDLSFQNLKRSDALSFGGLSNIRVLKLDNNKLEAVHGLESLAGTLETLDLSFNVISDLGTSLHRLKKLSDLSLANNRFTGTSILGALDGQTKTLEVLSLANNPGLFVPAVLLYLGRFPQLSALALQGTAGVAAAATVAPANHTAANVAGKKPLAEGSSGKMGSPNPMSAPAPAAPVIAGSSSAATNETILSALPKLSFLNWQLVTSAEKRTAEEGHSRAIGDIRQEVKRALASGGKKGMDISEEQLMLWLGGGKEKGGDEGKEEESETTAAAPGGSPGRPRSRKDTGSPRALAAPSASPGSPRPRPDSAGRVAADKDVFEAGLQYIALLWKVIEDHDGLAEVGLKTAEMLATTQGLTSSSHGVASVVPASTARELPARTPRDPSSAQQEALVMRIPGPIPEKMGFLRESIAFSIDSTLMRGLALYAEQQREVMAATSVLESYLEMDPSLAILRGFGLEKKKLLKEQSLASLTSQLRDDYPDEEALLASLSYSADHPQPSALLATSLARRRKARLAHSSSGYYSRAAPAAPSADDASGSSRATAAREEEEDMRERATIVTLSHLLERAREIRGKLQDSELELHDQAMTILLDLDAAYRDIEAKRGELFLKLFRDAEKAIMAVGEDIKAAGIEAAEAYQEHSSLVLASFGSSAAGAGSNKKQRSAEPVISGSRFGGIEGDDTSPGGTAGAPVYDEEMAVLLGDKDAVVSAISGAMDSRLSRALAAEDRTKLLEKRRYAEAIRSRIAAEAERHRNRMVEVQSAIAEVEAALTATLENVIGEEEEEEASEESSGRAAQLAAGEDKQGEAEGSPREGKEEEAGDRAEQ